jgi:hypothetical protein
MSDECQKNVVNDKGYNWGEGKCAKNQKMKANELNPGQEFKLPGQRKFRTVTKVIELTEFDHIPPVGKKVLVIHDGCRQLSVLRDEEVIVR